MKSIDKIKTGSIIECNTSGVPIWKLNEEHDEFYTAGDWKISDFGILTGVTSKLGNELSMCEVLSPNYGKCWIHFKYFSFLN